MAFVYFLQNEEGRYYIGSTENLENRLGHHFGGHTPSTSKMRELKLVFKQKYNTLSEARRIEIKLKKLHRHDYITKIINDGYIKIRP
jgi:putative endonuclease